MPRLTQSFHIHGLAVVRGVEVLEHMLEPVAAGAIEGAGRIVLRPRRGLDVDEATGFRPDGLFAARHQGATEPLTARIVRHRDPVEIPASRGAGDRAEAGITDHPLAA